MASTIAVLSPHLDDGVLSCAELLAAYPGSLLVTLFAGGPTRVDPLPEWDAASGFNLGDDVMKARRAEDRAAAAELGAIPHHLNFWDFQYRAVADLNYSGPQGKQLVKAASIQLQAVIDDHKLDAMAIPLGISHPDHVLTAMAALNLVYSGSSLEWWAYEDLPYSVESRSALARSIAKLSRSGFRLTPLASSSPAKNAKRQAIAQYESQTRALGERTKTCIQGPEQLYRLTTVPSRRSHGLRARRARTESLANGEYGG